MISDILTHGVYLQEWESQHEGEVTDPVEGQRETHGSSTGLLSENLTHNDEGNGTWRGRSRVY